MNKDINDIIKKFLERNTRIVENKKDENKIKALIDTINDIENEKKSFYYQLRKEEIVEASIEFGSHLLITARNFNMEKQ